jgi:hypothetical protein
MEMKMSNILNLNRPHRALGPFDDSGSLFVEQDGKLFCWSESNVRYERAWWLDHDIVVTPLVIALRKERPDPRELK